MSYTTDPVIPMFAQILALAERCQDEEASDLIAQYVGSAIRYLFEDAPQAALLEAYGQAGRILDGVS